MSEDSQSGNDASNDGAALIAEHKEVTRKLRMLSIAFPIVLMVVIVWNLTALANTVEEVDTNAVASELADRANTLKPMVEQELASVATAVKVRAMRPKMAGSHGSTW